MRKLIFLLAPMVLLLGLGLDLYLPSEHQIVTSLNLSYPQIQMTLSIYMYFFGLGQLIIGPIADHLGYQKPLKISLGLFIIGSLIIALTDQYYVILVGRAMQALGACGATVIALAIVRSQTDGKDTIKSFTYLKGISTLAPILAPSLGVMLAHHWGWRADFYFLTLFGLFALICSFGINAATPPVQNSNVIKLYLEILKNRTFKVYAFTAGLVQSAMFGYFSISPIVYIHLLGLSEKNFAILFSANACMFLVVAFSMAKHIATIGIKRSVLIGATLFLLAGCSMMIYQHLFSFDLYALFLPNLLASAGAAFALGASNSGAMIPFKNQPGKAASLLGCIEFMIGGLLGSLVVLGTINSVTPLAVLLIGLSVCIYLLSRFTAYP